jgi:hypothetical protein
MDDTEGLNEQAPNYSWELRVGTEIKLSRHISINELEALLKMPVAQQEAVKNGLRALFDGEFTRTLITQREFLLKGLLENFDKEWDRMVKAHNKKVGRE